MTDENVNVNKAPNPDPEEEADLFEIDDIQQFIRKIQLQSEVLKKLSVSLEKPTGKDSDKLKTGN